VGAVHRTDRSINLGIRCGAPGRSRTGALQYSAQGSASLIQPERWDMLPGPWLAPEEIQRPREKTRLRKALADDHTVGTAAAHRVGARGRGMEARVAAHDSRPAVGRCDPSCSRFARVTSAQCSA
jgi:hypothetical protein